MEGSESHRARALAPILRGSAVLALLALGAIGCSSEEAGAGALVAGAAARGDGVYRLDLELPAGLDVDDFYATFLRPTAGQRRMHRLVANDPDALVAAMFAPTLVPGALDTRAPLERGDPVRTRLRPPSEPGEDPALRARARELHVRSLDGTWSGSATVHAVAGEYPELVPIALERKGEIEGKVVDGAGAPVQAAWIQLFDAAGGEAPVHEIGADPEGQFAFHWLAPSEHRLVVLSDRFEDVHTSVTIELGVTRRVDVELSVEAPAGVIAGILRSRTGKHVSKGGVLSLTRPGDPEFLLMMTATYRNQAGESVAPFSFADVPAGDYELTLKPLDNLPWDRRTQSVTAPATGLEFVCEDDRGTFDLTFRGVDAATGAPIDAVHATVWLGDTLDNVRLGEDWGTGFYRGVPEGVPLSWMLSAENYRLARGDTSSLPAAGDPRVVEVRLERGWGQAFKVTNREQEPLEGVELLADDTSVGVTDAQGMIWMILDARPARLEFRLEGWRVSWGRVDPAELGFGGGPETPVYLSPVAGRAE